VMCFFNPACLNPRMADTIVGNSTNTCKESRGEKSTRASRLERSNNHVYLHLKKERKTVSSPEK
jgi:hypothetical protein